MTASKSNANERYLQSALKVVDLEDLLTFPYYFEIETVHACNARCRMCTIDTWPERDTLMDDHLFLKIVDELAIHNDKIRTITLCRDGEPLLDKALEKKIQMLKKAGINNVVFSTNASLLDERRGLSLLDSGLDEIMFSIDASSKEVFEQIRTGLDFDLVVRNILRFIELRNLAGSAMKIRIRMIVQNLNVHEFESWYQFWSTKTGAADMVYGKPVHSWGNQLDISGLQAGPAKGRAPLCVGLWSTMIIHSDGSVPVCAVDYKNKFLNGHVCQEPISQLWQKDHFKAYRQSHLQGQGRKLDMCHECYLWDSATFIGKE